MTKDNPCLGICPGRDKKKGCMKSTWILLKRKKIDIDIEGKMGEQSYEGGRLLVKQVEN